MQKWEYCQVDFSREVYAHKLTNRGKHILVGHPSIVMGLEGEERRVVERDDDEVFARIVAELGEDGWEMVTSRGPCVYFKRPKAW